MNSPMLAFKWGEGYESERQRELARPVLEHARSYAYDGLTYLGLANIGTMHVIINAGKPGRIYGEATGGKTQHLYLRPNNVELNDNNALIVASCMVHETVHCKRRQTIEVGRMLEYSATEGIAYNAEREFTNFLRSMFGKKCFRPGVVASALNLSESDKEIMSKTFLAEVEGLEEWSEELHEKWFKKARGKAFVGEGILVGINAVSRRLEAGQQIAELITMPTRELLNIA